MDNWDEPNNEYNLKNKDIDKNNNGDLSYGTIEYYFSDKTDKSYSKYKDFDNNNLSKSTRSYKNDAPRDYNSKNVDKSGSSGSRSFHYSSYANRNNEYSNKSRTYRNDSYKTGEDSENYRGKSYSNNIKEQGGYKNNEKYRYGSDNYRNIDDTKKQNDYCSSNYNNNERVYKNKENEYESSDNRNMIKKPTSNTYVPSYLPENDEELFKNKTNENLINDYFELNSITEVETEVTGGSNPSLNSVRMNTFDDKRFLINKRILDNLIRCKYSRTTPIQRVTIPLCLGSDDDIMACAQTGSGKTACFLVPTMTKILDNYHKNKSKQSFGQATPLVLVVAPTRELVTQTFIESKKFSYETGIICAQIYGGVKTSFLLQQFYNGCDVLIATPGRLIDFLDKSKISLAGIKYFILDEADRMLDMGFIDAIKQICYKYDMPDNLARRTLMFSATFPIEIQRLAKNLLKANFYFAVIGKLGNAASSITQEFVDVPPLKKRHHLLELLKEKNEKVLVFVESKRNADYLTAFLCQNDVKSISMHGDRTQEQREEALQYFADGTTPVLIATSVASRGLDIDDVNLVVNYELPQSIDDYVHRIGRTGRIGKKGHSISYFQIGKDNTLARNLVKMLIETCQIVPEWLKQIADEAVNSAFSYNQRNFLSRDARITSKNSQRINNGFTEDFKDDWQPVKEDPNFGFGNLGLDPLNKNKNNIMSFDYNNGENWE